MAAPSFPIRWNDSWRFGFFAWLVPLVLGSAAHLTQARSAILINEFMAANARTLLDEDGASSDWIELYNSGSDSVNLDGWFLTDATNSLTKWRMPAVTMLPDSYLVIFASGKNRTNA